MKIRIGNPNRDRTALPPCGLCANCEKVKILPSMNKHGLKLFLFDTFISGSNMYIPERACDFLRDYPCFGVNVLKVKPNSKILVSSIKNNMFQFIAFRIINLKYDEDQSEIILVLAIFNVKYTDLAMN